MKSESLLLHNPTLSPLLQPPRLNFIRLYTFYFKAANTVKHAGLTMDLLESFTSVEFEKSSEFQQLQWSWSESAGESSLRLGTIRITQPEVREANRSQKHCYIKHWEVRGHTHAQLCLYKVKHWSSTGSEVVSSLTRNQRIIFIIIKSQWSSNESIRWNN